jgi:kynurenine formamidase
VLLDVPRFRGDEWLEPGTAVEPEELEAVASAQDVRVGRGDIVLVRTGQRRRRAVLGAWDPSNFSAGLYPTSMRWLLERQLALLGSDGDNDARPSPVDGVASPIHALALAAMGLLLVDNLNVEDLAGACEELGRWEFLFVLAPLRIPGGTGSPVNPVAVF